MTYHRCQQTHGQLDWTGLFLEGVGVAINVVVEITTLNKHCQKWKVRQWTGIVQLALRDP